MDRGIAEEKWKIRCNPRYGADWSLLVCAWQIPAGQRNEANTSESPSREEVKRTG